MLVEFRKNSFAALEPRSPLVPCVDLNRVEKKAMLWDASALDGYAIEASDSRIGSVGDSYDNALRETINGLYTAEVIHRGAMALVRSRRIRHPQTGGLVQPSPAAGAHRRHAPCRNRRPLLRCARTACHSHSSVTQIKTASGEPGAIQHQMDWGLKTAMDHNPARHAKARQAFSTQNILQKTLSGRMLDMGSRSRSAPHRTERFASCLLTAISDSTPTGSLGN